MFGSVIHFVASIISALQVAVLIILKFIKKIGDGQVDLEQIEKEKQHDAKKISEIWSADFASAWTHVRRADFNNNPCVREFGLSISNTMMDVRGRILPLPKLQYGGLTFIILPGDESRSPKQLQMDETVPNSEPMKQITAPFLDSCGDNAVDADDSKFMRFIKKVGDGQVVSPFLFVLNQHDAKKIPEIWSADFASAWTHTLSRNNQVLQLLNSKMRVILCDNRTFIGKFVAYDKHMNLVLTDCVEYRKYKHARTKNVIEAKKNYGVVILHGENVMSVIVESSDVTMMVGAIFIHLVASKISALQLAVLIILKECDGFLHKLTSVEDWLYGVEEKQEAVYKERLDELKIYISYC